MSKGPRSTERLEVGLPAATREIIEHAAAIEGVSLTAFLIGNATRGAKQVIAEHEALTARRRNNAALSGSGW